MVKTPKTNPDIAERCIHSATATIISNADHGDIEYSMLLIIQLRIIIFYNTDDTKRRMIMLDEHNLYISSSYLGW